MPKKKEKGLEIIVNVGDLLKKGKQSPTPSNPFKGGDTGFPKMPPKKKKKKKKKPLGLKGGKGTPERTEKPGVPHGVDKKTQEGGQILNIAKGGSVSKFGMLSVKAGIDNNPNPTQADRIAGATKKMKRGGKVTGRSIGPAGASIVSDDGKSCLLYTSPSPRDGLLSRMPSSA